MGTSSMVPPSLRIGEYLSLKNASGCQSPQYDIETVYNVSLGGCLRRCDKLHEQHQDAMRYVLRMRNCENAMYYQANSKCILKGHCTDRRTVVEGPCPMLPSWCFFTRGPLTKVSEVKEAETRTGRLRAAALQRFEAEKEQLRQQQLLTGEDNVCLSAPQAVIGTGKPITSTNNHNWRYYSILECGSPDRVSSKLCLTFKSTGKAAHLGGLISSDGENFHSRSEVLRLPGEWQENLFTHNVALLRLEGDEYVMLGGKQGFVSSGECRWLHCRPTGSDRPFARAHGRCRFFKMKHGVGWVAAGSGPAGRRDCAAQGFRASEGQPLVLDCLRNNTRQDCLIPDQRLHRTTSSSYLPATGIRLSRGYRLPWNSRDWTRPEPIISGMSPSGCIDRRPQYTGYPRIQACEFDGRLSAVRHRGIFRLYARANLKFGAVAGGRFVQTTSSPKLENDWQPWVPVKIANTNPDKTDIYFYAVQSNPVDRQSLVAIFPLTHPPCACIMLAFSSDGILFSRPIRLRMALLGARTQGRGGTGRLEWRSEDHPAAGIVRAPNDTSRLFFYIHHSVRGTTMREDARTHVRSYMITTEEMLRLTRLALYNTSAR